MYLKFFSLQLFYLKICNKTELYYLIESYKLIFIHENFYKKRNQIYIHDMVNTLKDNVIKNTINVEKL